ncbi:MAG TPA: hypothetical protein VN870_09205 [Streptosporangiaceae bacterium]|nr:hypothetical protein [Streptosporangiaceae bacterium]
MPSSTGSIVPGHLGDEGGLTKGRLAAFFTALAGSAVLGIVAGLIWAVVAPRALLQEVAHGEAQYVNVETTAFIVADAWFFLITAIGGLITGILGYRILVRRAGAAATAGLVLGAVAAALLALWVGDNIGFGTYNHLLATSPAGTFFHDSLALGAKSALAFWPLFTSVVVLLAESGARRSAQAAAQPRHRKQPDNESGMWTQEPPEAHAP